MSDVQDQVNALAQALEGIVTDLSAYKTAVLAALDNQQTEIVALQAQIDAGGTVDLSALLQAGTDLATIAAALPTVADNIAPPAPDPTPVPDPDQPTPVPVPDPDQPSPDPDPSV